MPRNGFVSLQALLCMWNGKCKATPRQAIGAFSVGGSSKPSAVALRMYWPVVQPP